MKLTSQILSLALLTVLAAACGPGGSQQPGSQLTFEQQVATMVAGTMSAGGPATPVPSFSLPTSTATVQPTLFINTSNASCRGGPSPDFRVVASYAAGTTVNLVGKDTAHSYWIVQDPTSGDLCWISVQDATPAGSFESLPEMTPRPVTGPGPNMPGSLNWSFYCTYVSGINYTVNVQLNWTDAADNEAGYRIYRSGTKIADLPANTTTFSEKTDLAAGSELIYGVAAFNEAGESAQRKTNRPPISCQK